VLRLQLKKDLTQFELELDVSCRYAVTAIYGPSGAGKTSLLNMVAGLLPPDSGEIALDDQILFSSARGINLAPEKRRIGYVFQDDLLFPHLDVETNLRYGHDLLPAAQRRFAPDQIVDLLQLSPLLKRSIRRLSGGERQRIALGRALLSSPQLLLMDEPLASLDQGLKSRIIPYLRHIRREFDIPILYVSHSVAEILELTGQVIVLEKGQVLAHGDFFKIASQPGVLPLIEEHGFENVLPVEIIASDPSAGFSRARCGEQEIKIPFSTQPIGSQLFIGLRADDIILSRKEPEGLSIRNALRGKITEIIDVGGTHLVYVDVGRRLASKITREAVEELELTVGSEVFCLIKTHSLRLGPQMT
jgi:molybdate transport system ATP-binding protein